MSTPTFVLVPGAGGMASYWDPVRERLSERGFASVAVDLPGPDPQQGLPAYVALILQAAAPFDDIIVVGQSLGGFSAAWAAEVLQPRELILLNAMIPAPGETAGQWWAASGAEQARRDNDAREGRDPDAPFDVDALFFHDVSPEAIAALGPAQDENDIVFAAAWGPTSWPDVPTRVIAATGDRLFPYDFQCELARRRVGVEAESVPGGHLCALSHPDELVEVLVKGH